MHPVHYSQYSAYMCKRLLHLNTLQSSCWLKICTNRQLNFRCLSFPFEDIRVPPIGELVEKTLEKAHCLHNSICFIQGKGYYKFFLIKNTCTASITLPEQKDLIISESYTVLRSIYKTSEQYKNIQL